MTNIFGSLAEQLGLKFQRVSSITPVAPKGEWDVFFNSHSQFDLSNLQPFRGLHVVRDPRDMIVSGTFYHGRSEESWLHVKRDEFGGMTYQEKINSYDSFDDKLLFELEHAGHTVLTRMNGFDIEDTRFCNARYEDLIVDTELKEFERIFKFLGFAPKVMQTCLAAAYENSLFSGMKGGGHVRSGKPKQWPEYFKSEHKKRFEELFPDILAKFHYEVGDEW